MSDAMEETSPPKHFKGGWGTEMDLDDSTAQVVLDTAIQMEDEKQLYGYSAGKVYVFQPHLVGVYHGYPAIKNGDVSSKALREMLKREIINKKEYIKLVKEVGGK